MADANLLDLLGGVRYAVIIPLVVTTILYGILCVLFPACLIILLKRKQQNFFFHVATSTALFICATTGMIFAVALALTQLMPSASRFGPFNSASMILYIFTNCIADSIIIFRCFVIWSYRKSILITAIILSVLNNATSLAGAIERNRFLSQARKQELGQGAGPTHAMKDLQLYAAYVFLIINFVVNLILSGMIAGKIWTIQRAVQQIFGKGGSTNQRYNAAIAITLESGLIYSISLLILSLPPVFGKEIAGLIGSYVLLIQIAAIAPTLIIVRAGLGISTDNKSFNTLSASRFGDSGTSHVEFSTITSFSTQPAAANHSYAVTESEAERNRSQAATHVLEE